MVESRTPKKRIIVCCDGTWMDSDGGIQVPSNVTRIARAIKPYGTDEHGSKIPQIVYYQNGIGTGSNSLYVKYVGGATGEGLAENIREAYSYICLNYSEGDEIFLLGFSRGAFTARSISSLIRAIGLLTAAGLHYFIQIFQDWQFQSQEGWKTEHPDTPWPGHKPPVDSPAYQRTLLEMELTRPDINIKAVAVWDTVGGLGIPMIGLLPQPPSTDFAFVDTKVERNIEYAFQALALDEHRRAFSPTIWEKPAGQPFPRVLKQCWFPGVHADVGGSYADTDLANLTLCWMVSQLDPLIAFEHNYVWKQVRLSIEWHDQQRRKAQRKHPGARLPPLRPWGLGKIHNSMTFFMSLGGSETRTPNEYHETEKALQHGTLWWLLRKLLSHLTRHLGAFRDDKPMPRLQNTHETVHSSVRIRMGKKGLGYDDRGSYDSDALEGWTFTGAAAQPDTPHQMQMPGSAGAMKNVVWRKHTTDPGPTTTLEMPEDEMGAFEMRILQLWPDVERDFDSTLPGAHRQHVSPAPTQTRAKTFPKLGHPAVPSHRRKSSAATGSSSAESPGLDAGGKLANGTARDGGHDHDHDHDHEDNLPDGPQDNSVKPPKWPPPPRTGTV